MLHKQRTRLVAVAQQAGVSIASASRVLNGLPTSDEVKGRVEEAARNLDYMPDAVARSLKIGRTEQIAFAVADVGNPGYVSMMHAVSTSVSDAGFRLVISSTGNDPAGQIEVLRGVNRGFADGLIIVPLRLTEALRDELGATRLPVAVIGTLPSTMHIDNVRTDSAAGVGLAIDHLHSRGRRRIAFVNGPLDTVPGTARLAGYVRAMKRLDLPLNAEMQVMADDFTFHAGLRAVDELLAQASPDAIMCANDLLAVAAMKALLRSGRRVPDDVAVVGMDDSELAEYANPSLTSVTLQSARRASEAAGLLLSRLEDPSLEARQVIVEPSLTIRDSTIATSWR